MRADQYSSSAFREGLETPRVFASMTKSLKEISSLLSSCSPSYARARSLRIMVMLKKSQRAKLTDMWRIDLIPSVLTFSSYGWTEVA